MSALDYSIRGGCCTRVQYHILYDAYNRRTPGAIVHKNPSPISIRKSKAMRVTIEDSVNCRQRSIPIQTVIGLSPTHSPNLPNHPNTSTTQTAEQSQAWKATPRRTTQQRRSLFASFLSRSGLPHESCGQLRTQGRTLLN
jgi:hypothetical protein